MPSDVAAAVVLAAIEGHSLSCEERKFLRLGHPAGVTLFRRNVPDDLTKLRELNREIQGSLQKGSPPFLIAVDQEGGRVSRVRSPFPDAGPAATIAQGFDDPAALAFLKSYGFVVGLGIRGLGMNVDFAPVLDVQGEETDNSIGDRAFGREPDTVSRRAGAFNDGLVAAGVLTCLKHFPGQGGARGDTHKAETIIDRSEGRLWNWDLAPFRELVDRAQMVMISHCVYSAIDDIPASRSAAVIEGLLRQRLGFRGLVVSDDMNMGAVATDDGSWQEALVASVVAGVDLILVCRHVERAQLAVEALSRAAERDNRVLERLTAAANSVRSLRSQLPRLNGGLS